MKAQILILGMVVLFFSCKKEETELVIKQQYDTIKPKEFFPVYPSSWWKYQLNDSSIIYDKVDQKYKLHAYKNKPDYQTDENEENTDAYTDSVYVPFLNSKPIYGYHYIEYIPQPYGDYYKKWPFLSEEIGFEFNGGWIDRRYDYLWTESFRVSEKYFDGQDSVIIIRGSCSHITKRDEINYLEYVKGIGLRLSLTIDTLNVDTLYKKELIDYYINK